MNSRGLANNHVNKFPGTMSSNTCPLPNTKNYKTLCFTQNHQWSAQVYVHPLYGNVSLYL